MDIEELLPPMTESALRAAAFGNRAARRLRHSEILAIDLLVGLLEVPEGVAARALLEAKVDLTDFRERLRHTSSSREPMSIALRSIRGKQVLNEAISMACAGQQRLCTAHIMLAILEGHGGFWDLLLDLVPAAESLRLRTAISKMASLGNDEP